MKTKNRQTRTQPATETFTVGPDPVSTPEEVSNGHKKDRLQFAFDLDEKGIPDFSSMREGTRKKVREIFNNPEFANAVGAKPASAPQPQIFHPIMIGGMYDVIGAIEATIIPKIFKECSPIVAKQVFTYTAEEKAALEGPTIRVLNKYVAEWMIRFQDEIALAMILTSLTITKVNAAIMLSKMNQGRTVDNVTEMPLKDGDEETPKTN